MKKVLDAGRQACHDDESALNDGVLIENRKACARSQSGLDSDVDVMKIEVGQRVQYQTFLDHPTQLLS
jgi:hypothetical protein